MLMLTTTTTTTMNTLMNGDDDLLHDDGFKNDGDYKKCFVFNFSTTKKKRSGLLLR
jgi:hypothetical protein